MTELPLAAEWAGRAKRLTEANKLRADWLWAEADTRQVDADAIWRAAVAARYGGVEIKWDNGACVVGGHRYEPITPPQSEAGR